VKIRITKQRLLKVALVSFFALFSVGGMLLVYQKVRLGRALTILEYTYESVSWEHSTSFTAYYQARYKQARKMIQSNKVSSTPFLVDVSLSVAHRNQRAPMFLVWLDSDNDLLGMEIKTVYEVNDSSQLAKCIVEKYPLFAVTYSKPLKEKHQGDQEYHLSSVTGYLSRGPLMILDLLVLMRQDSSQRVDPEAWKKWALTPGIKRFGDKTPFILISEYKAGAKVLVRLYDKAGRFSDWVPLRREKWVVNQGQNK